MANISYLKMTQKKYFVGEYQQNGSRKHMALVQV